MLASEDFGQLEVALMPDRRYGLGYGEQGKRGCNMKTRRTDPIPGTSHLCFLLRY